MNRLAVLACVIQLAACADETGPEDADLEETYFVAMNGLMFVADEAGLLANAPLATGSIDPSLRCDESTRTTVRYTVECALDAGQTVKFCGEEYAGQFGECPSWNAGVPSSECLQATSGCLIARNNKEGRKVRASWRGERAENPPFDVFIAVPSDTFEPVPLGPPIASFHTRCGPGGAARNCGWSSKDSLVGTCTPGAAVSVGAGAKLGDCSHPLGRATGDTVLRVCTDMVGCNFGDARHIASIDDTCGVNPATDFVCPASGVFNVMLSGVTEAAPFAGEVEATSASPVEFPIEEVKMFSHLEGSFMGNLFEEHNPNVTIVRKNDREIVIQLKEGDKEHTGWGSREIYPYENAWACHDPGWTAQDAYLHARLCADNVAVLDPSGNPDTAKFCIAQPLGPCNLVPASDPANICPIYDQAPVGDIDHDDCIDGNGNKQLLPMTVFLHDPCDMLSRQERELGLCARQERK